MPCQLQMRLYPGFRQGLGRNSAYLPAGNGMGRCSCHGPRQAMTDRAGIAEERMPDIYRPASGMRAAMASCPVGTAAAMQTLVSRHHIGDGNGPGSRKS